ncbi:MAG: hypothetical protein U5K54_00150 [Cytophagales bacterium]|nr:hypothetical protein [Cytophagales bacterium]
MRTDKNIGIEMPDGELHLNLQRFYKAAKVRYNKIVTSDDNPDVIVFWGTLYGECVLQD